MSIQQFCLRWNNHQPNFISVFTTLLNTESLVDVTLAAEGKHLRAHKVVLSACSVYFQTLFTENPSRHPIVILKDVKYSDLRIMVDFMYYGEVNVSQEQLPQILETAKLLKIKGLTEMPESTSLTRSQGTMAEFLSPGETAESQRQSVSPANSPSANKRKNRIRRPSNGSQHLSNPTMNEDTRPETNQPMELGRNDTITLSSLPQQRRRNQEYHDDRTVDAGQQTEEHQNNIQNDDPLLMETNPPGLNQGGQWSMMEHGYPRYSNACVSGSGLQQECGMGYISNVMSQHMGLEMNEYGQGVGVPGPSPGPSCQPEPAPSQPVATPSQPIKRRRTTNPQAEENFQRALEAVRFGGIGFCKAARLFGVNNRTLWLEYKKKGYPNNRPSIKSRIKRENTTPPLDQSKDEPQQVEQQMALLCSPHQVPVVGFIDSRPVDFPLQGVVQNPSGGRKARFLPRQDRVRRDSGDLPLPPLKRHSSHPVPGPSATLPGSLKSKGQSQPVLQKHSSHPPMAQSKIRATLCRPEATASLVVSGSSTDAEQCARASHTPAMRLGPPLSCHFCWNTVDECGRILRRKTQYHCPECRTNLCIVPCFHEYHDGHAAAVAAEAATR